MLKELIKQTIIKWLNTEKIIFSLLFVLYMWFPIYSIVNNIYNNDVTVLSIILLISYFSSIGFIKLMNLVSEEKRNIAINIIKQIKNSAKQLKSGDVFFLTYSGHGSQIPDLNHDEEDSLDECWIAYDKPILDDELEILWTKFNEGVKIVLISDSCHSGTMVKSLKRRKILHPRNLSFTVRNQIWSDQKRYNKLMKKLDKLADKKSNSVLKANIICLSACQDYQSAFEGESNGLFTECLLKIIHQNKNPKRGQKQKRLTPHYLITTAKKMLKGKQIPMYYKSDNIARTYLLQDIFSL